MTHRRRSFTHIPSPPQLSASCTPSGGQEERSIYSTTRSLQNHNFVSDLFLDLTEHRSEPGLTTDHKGLTSARPIHDQQDTCRMVVTVTKPKSDKRVTVQRLHQKNTKLKAKISKVLRMIQDISCKVTSEEVNKAEVPIDSNFGKDDTPSPILIHSDEEKIEPDIIRIGSSWTPNLSTHIESEVAACQFFSDRHIQPSAGAASTTHTYDDKSYPRRLPNAETIQQAILYHARCWSVYSGNAEEFIDRLEEYKSIATEHARTTFQFESAVKSLRDVINKCKNQQKTLGLKADEIASVNSHEEEEKLWHKADSFLMGLTPDVFQAFRSLSKVPLTATTCQAKFPSLNMHAVNRLSAILKMFKYCQDTNSDIATFQGRVKVYSKGYTKTAKPFDGSMEDSLKRESYYPKLSEFEYLLSLKPEQIEEEIFRLRSLILESDEEYQPHITLDKDEADLEKKLGETTESNKSLQALIWSRAEAQKKVVPRGCDSNKGSKILKRFKQMIPALKRKREVQLREEELMSEDCIGCDSRSFEKPFGGCYCYFQDARTTPSSVTATPPVPSRGSEGMRFDYPYEQ